MSMPAEHKELFMEQLKVCGYTNPRTLAWIAIAKSMNAKGFVTYRGEQWNADKVRSFVNNYHRIKVAVSNP